MQTEIKNPANHVNTHSIFVMDMLKKILISAISQKASDIHFEPNKNDLRIRMRIDGLLIKTHYLELSYRDLIISRLKVMAELDITERRLPQDGRFNFEYNNRQYDCRLNCCPNQFGEKLVVRIMQTQVKLLELNELGLSTQQLNTLKQYLHRPQGLILVTGPTGSGKTLTLYSALQAINHISKNIATIEDPIEINLPGINQTNVNSKIGLNFAAVLRCLLRQDPDVLMIGEIRDYETAKMAIQAAQTGHLVFSTLHTNSAVETLSRLVNIGVDSLNLANAINLIISQRLVRKLCPHCKIKQHRCITKNIYPFQAGKCANCNNGYQGRTGIFELLPFTENIMTAIEQKKEHTNIKHIAFEEQIETLKESAFKKVQEGITSLDESHRILGTI